MGPESKHVFVQPGEPRLAGTQARSRGPTYCVMILDGAVADRSAPAEQHAELARTLCGTRQGHLPDRPHRRLRKGGHSGSDEASQDETRPSCTMRRKQRRL